MGHTSTRHHRSLAAAAGICTLLVLAAVALAQQSPAEVQCKSTETQAECHHRLGCKPNEELEDCQKRLLKCAAGETLADCQKRVGSKQGTPKQHDNAGDQGTQNGNPSGNRSGDDRGNSDAGNRGRDPNENGERGDRTDRGDRGDRSSGRERNDRDSSGDSRRGSRDHRAFAANKRFGLGLEVGEPSGLTGKYFVSPTGALDFGVGAIYDYYYYGDGFHVYADYLWHPTSLVSAAAFELPVYIGVGLRYWDFHYCYMGVCDYGGDALGIRVPIGLAFDFNNVPLDIFLQAVPVIDFLSGDYYNRYGDREHFGIDVSAGIRFWFR